MPCRLPDPDENRVWENHIQSDTEMTQVTGWRYTLPDGRTGIMCGPNLTMHAVREELQKQWGCGFEADVERVGGNCATAYTSTGRLWQPPEKGREE